MRNNKLIFIMDFDGVILDSNEIKIIAYKKTIEKFENSIIEEFIKYHIQNPGISRYVKFRYLYENILNKSYTENDINLLADTFSKLVAEEILRVPMINGAKEFLEKYYQNNDIYVVSGTPEIELKDIVEKRNLKKYFKAIYGAPVFKKEHIANIIKNNSEISRENFYFFGDGSTDYFAANANDIAFIGVLNQHNRELFLKLAKEKKAKIINDFLEIINFFE